MKKLLVSVLSLMLAISLIACENDKEPPTNSSAAPSPQVESFGQSEQPASALESTVSTAPNEPQESAAPKRSYVIGDIILADGSNAKPEELSVLDSENLPIAVVAGLRTDGAALGLGVHHSDEPLPWISEEHPDDSPAFRFAEEYARTYGLTGAYANGWRMPDIDELQAIYQERETINQALQAIYQLDSTAVMDGLGTNWYWSSTPSDDNEDYAWFVHFVNGYAADCPQDFTNLHVLAVRDFD